MKIGNLDISAFKVGSGDCTIYLGNVKLYPTTPTPTSSCYRVIPQSISQYSSTDYDQVYSHTDGKWYMLNNLNQFEEYGIYDSGSSLSNFTYYDGKLVVVGGIEYQRSGNTWVEVGTYTSTEVTYTIDDTSPSPYVGQTLSTTFKIPNSDIEAVGWFDLRISTSDGNLEISDNDYRYMGSGFETGSVSDDGTYHNYSLPTTESIVIQSINYWNPTPIHLIVGGMQATVEYSAKTIPSSALTYTTVSDMNADECPTVGVGQVCGISGESNIYKFDSSEQWIEVQPSSLAAVGYYSGGTVGAYDCGYNGNVLEVGTFGSKNGSSSDSYGPRTLIIGDCVTSIGNSAFYGLGQITSATIGSGVTSIGGDAFSNCGYLTSIDIPDSVISIGGSAFYNCSSLTSATIGNGVTSIGRETFRGCSGLTSIGIPNSVTSIDNYAFYQCSGLTSITIPSSVTSIGHYAFSFTPWWNSYSANTNNRYGNIIYINNVAYVAVSSGITSATFKDSTIGIGKYAFESCSRLRSIDIPSSITGISDYAFYNCSGLTSVTIGSGVTTISDSAFSDCKKLKSVTIPNSVTSIGGSAFGYCSGLTSVTIGSGVTSISGYGAFYNCSSLTSVTINAVTPPTLGSSVFGNTNNCPIYVPSGSVDTYKAASGWSNYATRIQAIPT